jgi:hypothetical protein
MKAIMVNTLRRQGEEDKGKWSGSRGGGLWRSNNSGGRERWSRSDSKPWRKKADNTCIDSGG